MSASPRGSGREHAAQLRRAQERRRRRLRWAFGGVGVVVVVLVALVAVALTDRGADAGDSAGGGDGEADRVATGEPAPTEAPTEAPAEVPAEVLAAVTEVEPALLAQVGAGAARAAPTPVDAPALRRDGKPYVLYVGAEFCPFCAAQRWPMVVALSRFGTLTGLTATTSSSEDAFPDTATFSFLDARYTSDYLAFDGVETRSNELVDGQYAPLEQLTPRQREIVSTYNAPPYVPERAAGSIPFIAYGGQFLASGASFSPKVLAGKSLEEIAAALDDPDSNVGQAVLGAANTITAALCELTGGQPASVCDQPPIPNLQNQFSGGE